MFPPRTLYLLLLLCFAPSLSVAQSFSYVEDCIRHVDNATIVIPTTVDRTLPTGAAVESADTIAVRDEGGNCVGYGAGLSEQTDVAIAAAGPTSVDEATSGYEVGSALSFEIFDASEDTVVTLGEQVGYASCDTIAVPTCRDDGAYANGAVFVMDALHRPKYRRTISGTDGPDNDAGWRMLSVPAANAIRADLEDDAQFEVTTAPILYRFQANEWVSQTNSDDPLPRGTGFLLYVFDTVNDPVGAEGITLDVGPGTENPNSDADVTGLNQDEEWHLVGNPYDGAFDLGALAGGDLPGAGFQATVQIWDPAIAEYRQIVQGDAGDDVAAWQGFFVQRSTLGTGQTSLSFDASGRLTSDGSLIGSKTVRSNGPVVTDPAKRTASPSTTTTSPTHAEVELHLSVTSDDDASPARSRTIYRMDTRASREYDAYEAEDFPPPSGTQYVSASLPMSRNGSLVHRALGADPFPRESGTLDRSIPLAVRSIETRGTAVLSWPDSLHDRVEENWTVRLSDTKTDSTIDLRRSTYTFDLAEGDSIRHVEDARFRLELEGNARRLELAQFRGTASTNAVRLEWTTADERDQGTFDIQRQAADRQTAPTRGGDTGWKTIGTVDPTRSTSDTKQYRYEDTELSFPADTLRYRLRQEAADGSTQYSDPITVARHHPERARLLGAFPNPAHTRASIRFAIPKEKDPAQRVSLSLYDLMGRQVRTLRIEAEPGRHEKHIDVTTLSNGVYFLHLQTGSGTMTRKLTVIH